MGLVNTLISIIAIAAGRAALLPNPPSPHGVWPVSPHSVVRGFEPPSDAFSAGHRGVDLAGALGSPVMAALGGTVTFAGFLAGRGVVVISQGDTRTTYEPVFAEVHRGELIAAGTRIGSLDVVQSHCFPAACLHWGWLRGETYLDPMLLVQDSPKVRLLPLTPGDVPADRQP